MTEKQYPVVSIVCMTFNHQDFIRKTLDGFVFQKTSFPIEIIVHDDASTDKTVEIVREFELNYPSVFKPIYQKENQYSLEKGRVTRLCFEAARGKYISFCEGDDYWTDPLKLQKQVDFFQKHNNVSMVHTGYSILNMKRNTLSPYEFKDASEPFTTVSNYLFNAQIRTLTVMIDLRFKNSILDLLKEKFIIETPLLDRPMFLLLSQLGKIGFINEDMGVYRIASGQSASNFSYPKKYYEFSKRVNLINQELVDYLNIKNNDYKTSLLESAVRLTYLISIFDKSNWILPFEMFKNVFLSKGDPKFKKDIIIACLRKFRFDLFNY